MNLRRRHLDESQRAIIAAKLANMNESRPALWTTHREQLLISAILALMFWPDPVPKLKWSDLSGREVVKLFKNISFSMWRFGPVGIMNTHITILWSTLGIKDHNRATKLLGEYLNRAQRWARVGLPEARPSRQRRRARTCEGFIFRYVYVHECGGAHGFHSHILAHVPKEAVPAFAAWTRSILPQLARHQGTEQTVKVVASQERDERGAVDRCWCWFRYLTKQLDEDSPLRPGG